MYPEYAFCLFDEDADHYLSCDEFNSLFTLMAQLGLVTPGDCWPDRGDSICRLFSETDLNQDGFISWFEFQFWSIFTIDDCLWIFYLYNDDPYPTCSGYGSGARQLSLSSGEFTLK